MAAIRVSQAYPRFYNGEGSGELSPQWVQGQSPGTESEERNSPDNEAKCEFFV